MATCLCCGLDSPGVSAKLGYCGDCLSRRYSEIEAQVQAIHARSREPFNLPPLPPRSPGGLACHRCLNSCRLTPGQTGYCGLRRHQDGEIRGGDRQSGYLSWYHDPLPTNCVADWVCPGGTGAGFPRFAHRSGPEQGYTNLAVFYHACTFNCLFCQNWYFKQESFRGAPISAGHLAAQVDDATACICFFGGDPTPQAVHSLAVANQARAARGEGVLRICWETNGSMHPLLLEDMLQSALISGGCIKFDLKAFTPGLHQGLCGVSNKRTLANFQKAAGWFLRRPHPPLLVASTLLVPGYVSVEEVRQIAEFIAGLNPDIPYALLAFHPCFFLDDLPLTSRQHAQQALEAAGAAGLRRVRLGNAHLLS